MRNSLLLVLFFFQITFGFAQLNMQLLDQLNYPVNNNDVWGWVDPDDGTEYAVVGLTNGVSIVDLSDPQNIQEVKFISGPNSTWRDIKTWGNYIYVTNETSGGLLVINMTNAPNTITSTNWTPFLSGLGTLSDCHNLYIDEYGYCYLAGCNLNSGGILIVDVFSNPGSPIYVSKGPAKYAHDVFAKNNKMYTSEIYGGDLGIYNVANKLNIIQLASQETPYNFTHNAWVNESETVVFTTDEKANAPVAAYDITDLSDIVELDQFRPLETLGQGVIPHNVHVWDDWLIISYYTDGGIIADASRPENIIEVGNWDTFFGGNGGFSGVWGAYPFLPSGLVLLTDISNGLYVCGADYVRACWLEGQITDAVTGLPIFGADILIESSLANEATSDFLGEYKTGQATAGVFDVVVSAPGYITQTISVSLQNGVLTILDVELMPVIPVSSYSGTVKSAIDGTPISGAIVILQNSNNFFTTFTGADGIFTFNNIFVDNYTIAAARWGYQHAAVENLSINLTADPVVLEMYLGYQDDFFASQGWTTEKTATTGWWNRAEPVGTLLNGQFANPQFDIPDDISDRCFVTGNGGGSSGNDDVDDGMVRLLSPVMDMGIYYEPVLSYYTWFVNEGGTGIPNDTLEVRISNGSEEVVLEKIFESNANWNAKSEFKLSDYIELTSTMKVIFETSDEVGSGHIVEAGVDAFLVSESAYPAFTSSDTIGCPGDQIQFSDPSNFGFSWDWVFQNGNPASSTEQHPTVEYADAGSYDVSLDVMTKTGKIFTLDLEEFIEINSPPTAGFTHTVDTVSVAFDNASVGGTSFIWEFGDGDTSTANSPVHVYAEPGTYEVTLTVNGQCGPTLLTEEIVIPDFQPTALFSISSAIGCSPLEIAFTDLSAGFPDSWEWTFAGGTPASSTEQNPTVTYSTAGIYDVHLKVANTAGESEYFLENIVEISSTPTIIMGYTNDGANVTFENTSVNADSFEWQFNDGSGTTSSEAQPSHTFPGVGTYEVSLAATNNCGTVSSTLEVVILAIHPTAGFSVSESNGCTPFSVDFIDQSAGVPTTWSWQFPGGDPAASSEQNPTVTYAAPGIYSATLTVTNLAGESEISQTDLIVVAASPTPSFTQSIIGPDVTFTNQSSNADSYLWDFGDQTGSSLEENPTYTFPGLGTYEVSLMATNQCGTTSFTQTIEISVVQPTADFMADATTGCAPFSVQFTDQSLGGEMDSWEWEFPGGTPATSNEQNPTVTYSDPGTYSALLTVKNLIGESEAEKIDLIIVDDVPAPGYSFVVNGPEVIFTNTTVNGNSFEWAFGDNTGNTSNSSDTSYTFPDLGSYFVTLTATNGCGNATFTDTVIISAVQPTAAISADQTAGCAPFTVQFSDVSAGGEIDSWNWSFQGGFPDQSNEQNPVVVFSSAGNYEVSLQVSNPVGTSEIDLPNFIVVDDVPSAGFNFQTNGPEVTFTNSSSNATSYLWEFGDSLGSNSSESDPFFVFENIGDYTITLTATNDCGSHVFSQIVTITSTTATIDKSIAEIDLTAFPNPFRESVSVEYKMADLPNGAEIALFNTVGNKVASKPIETTDGILEFGTIYFPGGIYFVQLLIDGAPFKAIKIVKL